MNRKLQEIEDPQEEYQFIEWYKRETDSQARQVSRLAWSTFVALTWANFENKMDAFRIWMEHRETSDDSGRKAWRRKHGIFRIRKHIEFFENHNLRVAPHFDDGYFEGLYLVRNAIAHANGSIGGLDREDDRREILKFIENSEGLGRERQGFDEYGVLFVEKSFASNALAATQALLNILDLAVEQKYFSR